MGKTIDLTGQRFGRLVVIRRAADKINSQQRHIKVWECRCDCGKYITVDAQSLKSGNTKSCGCLFRPDLTNQKFGYLTVVSEKKEKERDCRKGRIWICKCQCGKEAFASTYSLLSGRKISCGCKSSRTRIGEQNRTHGLRYTRIYNIYANIRQRCLNERSKLYKNYGGRGITICKEWLDDFMNFYNWSMSNGYSDDLTLDRIDVNGNYEPSNCRWVNQKIQQNNRRTNMKIEYKGESKTLSEWCEELKLPYGRTHLRLRRGWSAERAFNEPGRFEK